MILLFHLNPGVNLPASFMQPHAVAVESASSLSGCLNVFYLSLLGQEPIGKILVYSGLLLMALDMVCFQHRLSH